MRFIRSQKGTTSHILWNFDRLHNTTSAGSSIFVANNNNNNNNNTSAGSGIIICYVAYQTTREYELRSGI